MEKKITKLVKELQEKNEEYKKAETIEDTNYVCSICYDEPGYCYECEEGLPEDGKFYCDEFGQHLCPQCYKKNRSNIK